MHLAHNGRFTPSGAFPRSSRVTSAPSFCNMYCMSAAVSIILHLILFPVASHGVCNCSVPCGTPNRACNYFVPCSIPQCMQLCGSLQHPNRGGTCSVPGTGIRFPLICGESSGEPVEPEQEEHRGEHQPYQQPEPYPNRPQSKHRSCNISQWNADAVV